MFLSRDLIVFYSKSVLWHRIIVSYIHGHMDIHIWIVTYIVYTHHHIALWMSIYLQQVWQNSLFAPLRGWVQQAACQPFKDTKNHGRIPFEILGAVIRITQWFYWILWLYNGIQRFCLWNFMRFDVQESSWLMIGLQVIILPCISGITTIQEGNPVLNQPVWWNNRGIMGHAQLSTDRLLFRSDTTAFHCISTDNSGTKMSGSPKSQSLGGT